MNVEIEMPVAELKPVLSGMGKVINRSSSLPVLGCLKLICDRTGQVQVLGTNLDDYLTTNVGRCVNASAGEILVPFEELNKIAKNCSRDQSIRLFGDGKEITVRYPIGNSFAERKLGIVDVKEWPETPVVREQGIAVSEELKRAIRHSLECSSDDSSRHVIRSVCLDVRDPKAHYVVGTNGSILFSANSFTFVLKETLVIPNRKFLGWSGFWEDGVCSLSVQPMVKNKGGWIQLRSGRWTFVTKPVEGEYPNWKQVIPNSSPATTLKLNDDAVEMMLSALPKMPGADGPHKTVALTVEQTSLLLQAKQKDADAWTTLPVIGATVKGKPISISLNRDYLIKALQFGLTEVELTDNMSPLVFKSGGRKLIVMPVRPDGVPKPASQGQPTAPAAESPETETPTERSSMPQTVNRIQQHQSEQSQEPKQSSFEQLQKQVEGIKDTLKGVVTQLNDVLKMVAQAHREKRATEKEIESVRDSLKEIQSIQI